MKIKLGNELADTNEQPAMIVFDNQAELAETIKQLQAMQTKPALHWVKYPNGLSRDKVEQFMDTALLTPQKNRGPVPPAIMQAYGELLSAALPDKKGFMLVVYDFDGPGNCKYAGYIGNGQRAQSIKALRECAESLGSQLN